MYLNTTITSLAFKKNSENLAKSLESIQIAEGLKDINRHKKYKLIELLKCLFTENKHGRGKNGK